VLEPGDREEGAIWRADPKIEPSGLDIGGTSRETPTGGGVDLQGAGESHFAGLGVLEPGDREGGRFGARIRKSSPAGSMSVGPTRNHEPVVGWTSRVRERAILLAWGCWGDVWQCC